MLSGKKRSRNILSLPTSTDDEASQNPIENSDFLSNCLGENINNAPETPISSMSNNTSDFEGILDLGIKVSGLSSSSSLSWSDEYESEINKKVQLELEKLDRIFQGLENDSISYDINEIAEWKLHFPNIYILGHNTPTNSAENSDASTASDEEGFPDPPHHQQQNLKQRYSGLSRNQIALINKPRSEDVLNPTRNYNSLPRKPKSLDVEQYLKISSIGSSDTRKRKQHAQILNKQISRDFLGDVSSEYTSLPFISATSLKAQIRNKRNERNPPKMLILPPIENSFRSISATPRQASTKSMYVSLNYASKSRKESQAAKLKSDLMKLFDHIPISNR